MAAILEIKIEQDPRGVVLAFRVTPESFEVQLLEGLETYVVIEPLAGIRDATIVPGKLFLEARGSVSRSRRVYRFFTRRVDGAMKMRCAWKGGWSTITTIKVITPMGRRVLPNLCRNMTGIS